jgi:hypothetical protein
MSAMSVPTVQRTLQIDSSWRCGRLLFALNDAGRVEVTGCREDRCVLIGDFDAAEVAELRDWLGQLPQA